MNLEARTKTLRPIGFEWWKLTVSSPYGTGPFRWIWSKWRVVSHRPVLVVLYPPVSEMAEQAEMVDQKEFTPPFDYEKQVALWKTSGYI